MTLPPVLALHDVQARLLDIFPDGMPNRGNCVRDIAAKTVFVMLYVGAVDGAEQWMRPDQVRRMTDAQSIRTSEADRLEWRGASTRSAREPVPGNWISINTRESVRDETLRNGLVPAGAVVTRNIATTSSHGRYALQTDFAGLFDPSLSGPALLAAMSTWRERHLNPTALARVLLMQQGMTRSDDPVFVTLPNGERRRMSPGPSSVLSKAVIEQFAPRYLKAPAVLWLSESARKVVERDDAIARRIGLMIEPERNLPDIILADLSAGRPRLIFVEVVNTDGHVTEMRKDALLAYAAGARFPPEQVSFVTAYFDRGHQAFKKTVASLAWGAYAWFMSEPDRLLILSEKEADFG